MTPTQAATPNSAVVVATQAAVVNLDEFPEAKFNRLIPTQTIRIPSDLLVPVVQIVQLDWEADTYKSNDVPAGHRAVGARGLNKLVTAAGVSFFDEHREDDGSDPDVIRVSVMASMLLPTGQRITAPGVKQVNLNNLTWASPAQRAKYKSFFYEQVSTRARNRAIRALLSLRASYPEAEIRKPFAVVSYAPNMDHPAIRERMLDSVAPRPIAALYGPETKALGAGEAVQELRQIPEDDDYPMQVASPTGGDRIDGTAGEPDWFAATEPTEPDAKPLATVLRDSAEASGLKGAATQPQKEKLQSILGPLGLAAVSAGFVVAFGIELGAISAAQAQAVIAAASGDDAFAQRWTAMVQAAA